MGLLAGFALGLMARLLVGEAPWLEASVRYWFEPLGRMGLGGLIMVVIPLILSTLALGVAGLGLGATMNMNGTALFEGATVLFLAQVFGVHLGLVQRLLVELMSVVTAIGVAGIAGGSLPLLRMVLGMAGIPPEGIAIILGVDRLLDMSRTVLNVTGDLVTATLVERFCGVPVPLEPERGPFR